ncbi:hypothetical protein CK203_092604 [Vitis vinifera]|uniref:Uncharacterized protein n=1 Tax=Vitis vinifera TaxID=29760 RepID=A0A438BUU8_VITVI|nr:hypothetical protein CK203_092604 [Vitis vinifera]
MGSGGSVEMRLSVGGGGGGISRTDCALLEEDARYDNALSPSGMVALDPPSHLFSSFGRTPSKESFDRSGDLVDSTKGDSLCNGIGSSEQFVGKCWDLVEINNDSMEETKIQSMNEGLVRSLGSGGVYGPFSKEDKETLWGELGAIRGIWDDPWCLGGDFNVTLNLGERSNQGRLTGAMRRFAQVVDDLELLDIPLQGGGGGGFLEWGKE